MKRIFLKSLLTFLFAISSTLSGYACTIFVLTDSANTLFFNNEDYSNPVTRIWFLPGSKNYYGVAYVGFDNDWAQGGVNAAGLAFDWVSGYENEYVPGLNLLQGRGNNPSQRMLESCATIEEAIAFYQKYKEPAFSYARLMIADKTGASVIIGAKNGQLYFDRSTVSRGFGYGEKALVPLLEKMPTPTIQNGLPILNACSQKGQFATKYSSIYNLRSGEIFLVPAGQQTEIKFNLLEELSKGGHYYNMPDAKQQSHQVILSLTPGMKRYLADGYVALIDKDSAIGNRLRLLFENTASGNLKEQEFSTELWNQMAPHLKNIQEESKKMGEIQSLILVERKEINSQRSYLYLMEFETLIILQRFGLNEKDKVAVLKSEAWEFKARK